MIITRLKLAPFGFFSNRELEFKNGLNVILGPNEAGKSTAFHAIQKALFTSTKLTKPEFRRDMERFCPMGGDTMHVELAFSRELKTYSISRSWGSTKASKFTYPDGSILTDEEKVLQALNEILPANPGTFKSLLMTYQSGLAKTLDELKGPHAETVRSLGDILRKAVLETDGVSIEQFKQKVETLYEGFFKRWDKEKRYPEGGRGLEKPWENEVGKILAAFYKKEALRVKMEKTRLIEDEFDRVNNNISNVSRAVSGKNKYWQDNSRFVQDEQSRRAWSKELTEGQARAETITKINSDWPVRESRIKDLNEKIPVNQKEIERLELEKNEAERKDKNRALNERFARAIQKKNNLDEAETRGALVKKLDQTELEKIVTVSAEAKRLKTAIKAGRLSLTVTALKDIDLSAKKDTDPNFPLTLKKGNIQKVDAGGLIRLEHADWKIEISSGEGDIKGLLEDYDKAEKQLKAMLEQYGAKSVEEITGINKAYEKYVGELEKYRSILVAELGDLTFEELKAQIAALGPETINRPLGEVITALEQTKAEAKMIEKDRQGHLLVLGEYEAGYGDKTNLLFKLAALIAQMKQLQDNIATLAPLPPAVKDIEAYIQEYDKNLTELHEEQSKLNALMIEKAGMEGRLPEVSAEELERQQAEAQEEFELAEKKGEAIAKIMSLTETLLGEMDSGSNLALKKDIEEYVSVLTDNRYARVEMDKTLPQGFVRQDGKTLSYDLLSAGTKDLFSLSLRLAMANHFLKEANGFIIMDDPLVDLDPERQRRAAALLKAYAAQKQVIIFTCHPSHAELLGGNRIDI